MGLTFKICKTPPYKPYAPADDSRVNALWEKMWDEIEAGNEEQADHSTDSNVIVMDTVIDRPKKVRYEADDEG